LSIRGVGRQGQTEAQDPSVGFIVDGVSYGYNALTSSFDFTTSTPWKSRAARRARCSARTRAWRHQRHHAQAVSSHRRRTTR
jgi:hypothetical protein